MLSEISQTEKDKHYMIPCVDSKNAELIETEIRMKVCQVLGVGAMGEVGEKVQAFSYEMSKV